MRTCARLRSATCCSLLLPAFLLTSAFAAELPTDWKQLNAKEFLAAVDKADGTSKPEVVQHAWTAFLANESFVDSADPSALVQLLSRFGGKSESVETGDLAKYRDRIYARIADHEGRHTGMPLYELHRASSSLGEFGTSSTDRARLFSAWMEGNEWRSLPMVDLYNLFGFVNADSVDRRRFSARWTGVLTPPEGGAYTFRQVRDYLGYDSQLKIWVDNQLILDTSGEKRNARVYESGRVELIASKPVAFKVELVHDVDFINFSGGAPMAFITWQRNGGAESPLPASSFSPPVGSEREGQAGLQGEYFGTKEFTDLKTAHLDSTLDLVWSWPPAAPKEFSSSRDAMEEIASRFASSEYLQEIVSGGEQRIASELTNTLWRVSYRMSGTQRQALVRALRDNPKALEAMNQEAFGRLFRALYMLPGDEHLELVIDWSLVRSQPRCQPGMLPQWSSTSYRALNSDYYWSIGYFLQGPYWEDALYLREHGLKLESGACNLPIAYALCYAAREQGKVIGSATPTAELDDWFRQQQTDATLDGDAQATWLIARAFLAEVGRTDGEPRVGRGLQHLQDAMLTAETDVTKFWVLQEQAARLASLGREEEVGSLLSTLGERFTGTEQQQAMSEWRQAAKRLAERYETQNAAAREDAYEQHLAELRRRLDDAKRHNQAATILKYESLLKRAQPE